MNASSWFAASMAALLFALGPARAAGLGVPDATDPVAGMGVNIHFTDPRPGELEMLTHAPASTVKISRRCRRSAVLTLDAGPRYLKK